MSILLSNATVTKCSLHIRSSLGDVQLSSCSEAYVAVVLLNDNHNSLERWGKHHRDICGVKALIEAAINDFYTCVCVACLTERTVNQGNKKYVGGVPPASIYKWVKAAHNPPEELLQRPQFYLKEAVCRGFGAPKVLLMEKSTDPRAYP